MSTATSANATVSPIMRMGCTNVTLTYRWRGDETFCLQSASHGVQQLAGFDPSKGDVIGIDDIVEQTTAAANLSDIGKYITSAISAAGTTLYFDPTGHGLQGTPFAVIQGVDTNVAQLVADGGMKYIPDAISVTPQFETPLALRAAGFETVDLLPYAPGVGPQKIDGFNPDAGEVLELRSILNATTAAPDLSNIASYLSATTVNGDTVLSVEVTGAGKPGVAFAQLDGVSLSLSQLMADGAIAFDPSAALVGVSAGQVFQFRPEGDEVAILPAQPDPKGVSTLEDFSVSLGDALDLRRLFDGGAAGPSGSALGHYVSATTHAGSTQLWFDPTGAGHGGGVEVALLQNVSVSISSLLAANALHVG